jgi:nucleotide-binding universal stress UspA family protein
MGPALRALRVLPTDGSREAELARTTAIDLADSTNSELQVVTVAPGFPSYDIHNPSVVDQLRERAEDILNEQSAKIEQEGGTIAEKHLRKAERYRAQQIVKVAEDIGAGLIVMGFGIRYPRVVPLSYGTGTIEEIGEDVSHSRAGGRVILDIDGR